MLPGNATYVDAAKQTRTKKDKHLTLADVPRMIEIRIRTGNAGLDDVLGGGLFMPSVVLFSGSAGSGKSSLLMEVAFRMEAPIRNGKRSVLYVSSEEDLEEIRARAEKFGYGDELDNLWVLASEELGEVLAKIREINPSVVILDSLNDLMDTEHDTNDPMRNLELHTYALVDEARANKRALILVSHQNKKDDVVGTKKIQHRVHVVMRLDRVDIGEHKLRMLHCPHKNRKGPTGVEVYYEMTKSGLRQVPKPEDPDESDEDPPPKPRGKRRPRDAYDEMMAAQPDTT